VTPESGLSGSARSVPLSSNNVSTNCGILAWLGGLERVVQHRLDTVCLDQFDQVNNVTVRHLLVR
jgi:hypothetical protein